jgi:hypothetical protein
MVHAVVVVLHAMRLSQYVHQYITYPRPIQCYLRWIDFKIILARLDYYSSGCN